MKKLISVALTVMLLAALTACGHTSGFKGIGELPDGSAGYEARYEPNPDLPADQVSLSLHMQILNPPVNAETGEPEPSVLRDFADEYMMLYPNVSLEFYYGLNTTDAAGLTETMTVALASSSAPDLFFAWGNTMAGTGWLTPLTTYIYEPNGYEPNNEVWMDMFLDGMVFGQSAQSGGELVAIPFSCHVPGTVGVWYNVELFEEFGLTPPETWQQMMDDALVFKNAGVTGFAPWLGNREVGLSSWDFWVSLTPCLSLDFERFDTDADGYVSDEENVRSVVEGYQYAQNNAYVQNIFRLYKYKYTVVVDKDAAVADYEAQWSEGNVAMLEDGLWRVPVEERNDARQFEYGLFLHPPISGDTSFTLDGVQYTLDDSQVRPIEYTDNGPESLGLSVSYNVMQPGLQGRSESVVPFCADWMKMLTATDNISAIITEQNGSMLGATKTCAIPDSLAEWMDQPFAKARIGAVSIRGWDIGDTTAIRQGLLEQYVNGMLGEAEFFRLWDQEVYENVMEYVDAAGIDISGLNVYRPD